MKASLPLATWLACLAFMALSSAPQPASAQSPSPSLSPSPSPSLSPSLSPSPPPSPAAAAPKSCFPSCRSGYLCLEGTCVSACNPPCGAGQHCEGNGECVADPAAAPPPASTPSAPAAPVSTQPATAPPDRSLLVERPPPRESPSASSNVNVNVNVLGVLQLGLVPGIELGGRHVGFTARLRLMTTGVLSHFLLADTTDDEEFDSGIGIGGVLRYYSGFGGNMRGFYVGGGLEYVSLRVQDTTDDREAYDTTLIIPELDMGYRWVWGRFLLDLGGTAGYAVVTSKTTEDLSNGQDPFLYPNNAENQLYAMGVVDLGFFF